MFIITIIIGAVIAFLYWLISKKRGIFTKYYFYALILNLFSLYLFSKMMEDVTNGGWITKLDVWLNVKMLSLWNPLFNKIMIFITNIASPVYLSAFSLVLLGVLIYKKKWYSFSLLSLGMIGGVVLESLIKYVVQRARPENALIEVSGYSFPSGHATMAIIFFSLLLYLFKDDIKSKFLRYSFIIGNILLFLLIGFSRVYLNVHWFSDVLGGFGLGLFWLTFLILTFRVVGLEKNSLN